MGPREMDMDCDYGKLTAYNTVYDVWGFFNAIGHSQPNVAMHAGPRQLLADWLAGSMQ